MYYVCILIISVDMYLLCMIMARGLGGVLVVCGECYNLE